MEGEAERAAAMRMTTAQQTGLLPVGHHQYQPVLSEDLQSDFSVPQASDAPAKYSNKASLPWTPIYLRRVVLLSFITVFILIIIAIESLLVISNKNNGLATSNSAEHYLWTYGPTAFITGVATL